MKISKLHIEQFRHLENLAFDFTYPEDFHIVEKRGKALDKICFIGQSATGKTGLLELIEQYHSNLNNLIITSDLENNLYFSNSDFNIIKGNVNFVSEKKQIFISKDKLTCKNDIDTYNYSYIETGNFDSFLKDEEKKFLFYLKSNLISDRNIEIFTKNPVDLFEKYPGIENLRGLKHIYSKSNSIIFDENVSADLWLLILNEILIYRKKFTQKMAELLHEGLLSNPDKLSIEFKKWQKENPNKIEKFAKKFNPILERLNLEVDLVNTEYVIPIANKRNEEIIPIQNTSTGTKGLLLSFLPLFKLDSKDSIILIDEPERSLYPDMQMDLMDYYQNLAPEAQFIVATHSPFVAASFEPDERFILYFDNEGKVAVRRGSSPIGDDPNDMLKNDFDINYYNKFGEEAYKKYLKLKEDLANEKDPTKKKELLLETVKLGDTYNF
ncbi:AAA family ATPase [Flavobacterium jejuense]|uniref:AAA family ATPase n=1 Tax=Flavobacterium jejuense TaxID=1544455 RepID=A0ABX0IU14_9FLAO|nr:AAA family ATPase [Flavobacterium jejuense]NHN26023.1 AAA family ATPase [Flavobacterium jejuense]